MALAEGAGSHIPSMANRNHHLHHQLSKDREQLRGDTLDTGSGRWENTAPLRSRGGHTCAHMKHYTWSIQPPFPLTSLRNAGLDPDSPHPVSCTQKEGPVLAFSYIFQRAQTEEERQLSLDVGRKQICNKPEFKKHCLKSNISLCFALGL